jgi:hypothetical protein
MRATRRGLPWRRQPARLVASLSVSTLMAMLLVVGSIALAGWSRDEALRGGKSVPPRALGRIAAFGRCTEDKIGRIPGNMDEALSELDRVLDDDQRALLRDFDPHWWHHGLGTALRNCWGLWSRQSPLGDWFRAQGIFHPDDMSGAVLDSFRRRLNHKDIDLAGQIAYYQAYWRKQDEEYQKGTYSGNGFYHIAPFTKDEGWVHVSADNVPHIRDFIGPLIAKGGPRVEACWKRFPRTVGGRALATAVRVRVRSDGMLSSAEVVESELPAQHADCLARALLDIPVPAHAGATYLLELASYRNRTAG